MIKQSKERANLSRNALFEAIQRVLGKN